MERRVVADISAAIACAASSVRRLRRRLQTFKVVFPFYFPYRLLPRMLLLIGVGPWSRLSVGEPLMALSVFLFSYLLRRGPAARADTYGRGFPAHDDARTALSWRMRACLL